LKQVLENNHMPVQSQEMRFTGTPICRGIAIGRPFFFMPTEEIIPEYAIAAEAIEQEISRYNNALSKSHEEIKSLLEGLQQECILEGVAILDAHLQIIQDPLLTTQMEEQIRVKCKNADYIFQSFIKQYQMKFDAISDPFFRERFKDIQSIAKRILNHLRNGQQACLTDIPEDSIVFALDLTAFETAEAKGGYALAFVTKLGGVTSHAAIVAKAKGIPYVSSVDFESVKIERDCWVIVDGRIGDVIINPNQETLIKYKLLRNKLHQHFEQLIQKGDLVAETYDGYRVQLSANVETLNDLEMLHRFGGNGVGLLRTESAFLTKESFPTEEEQYSIYSNFVKQMKGLPIVIRTFDLGGDKYLRNQQYIQESNPFLGCRAIRFSLKEKEIFRAQLRAIWRVSAFGDVKVMFPMVSSLAELLEAKAILQETKEELLANGTRVAHRLPVGCMIEVPSSAIIVDLLAKECDFLSIGTNDLVQYTLAVDRSNHSLSNLYTPTHPGVLRLIRQVVSEANHHDIPVTVCGEVAADPRFAPLLLGLGVHELSVAARYLPIIKNVIRNMSIVSASKLAEQALSLATANQIEVLINEEYLKNVPEDCFYNC
jgi:phosphotransferase system enzyme I (PtsI)